MLGGPAVRNRLYSFGPRGECRTDSVSATDLARYWSHQIPGTKKGLGFVRDEVMNLFNRAAAIRVNKTVLTRNDGTAHPAFNPFTDTPVQGVHYRFGSDFSQPISPFDYRAPRGFSISFGLRHRRFRARLQPRAGGSCLS